MVVDTGKFLSENVFSVKLLGFWAPEHKIGSKIYKIYTAFMFITFVVPVPIAAILYFTTKETVEVAEIADSAYLISELTAYMFRMTIWMNKEDLIKRVILKLRDPEFNPQKPEQESYLAESSKTSRRVFQSYIGCCTCALFAWASVPLFSEKRILPLEIWYPFDPLQDTVVYVSAYAHLFLSVAGCTIINVSTSTLVAGLMIHATGQLKILKDSLKVLSSYALEQTKRERSDDENIAFNEVDAGIYRQIALCIQHHESIVGFVDSIESAFGTFSFVQFMAGSFIICMTAFELSIISPLNFKFYWMLIYMICMLLELLLFCWFGTELYYESVSLTDAIYMSDWYVYGPKSKKALFILMERSKRPLRVRAAKLFDLSLETFSTILRRAYSLFAVLQRMNNVRSA